MEEEHYLSCRLNFSNGTFFHETFRSMNYTDFDFRIGICIDMGGANLAVFLPFVLSVFDLFCVFLYELQ